MPETTFGTSGECHAGRRRISRTAAAMRMSDAASSHPPSVSWNCHQRLAGFLAAYAAVIELQVGPVSAILGLYLMVQCVQGRRRPDRVWIFALGALLPTLLLLVGQQRGPAHVGS